MRETTELDQLLAALQDAKAKGATRVALTDRWQDDATDLGLESTTLETDAQTGERVLVVHQSRDRGTVLAR